VIAVIHRLFEFVASGVHLTSRKSTFIVLNNGYKSDGVNKAEKKFTYKTGLETMNIVWIVKVGGNFFFFVKSEAKKTRMG